MTWFGKEVAPGKAPRKVNVFEHMMAHQGMLEQLPLFPYFGPGDIVPTGALPAGIMQEHYWRAVQTFNGNDALRGCEGCGAVHPPAELGDIAWPEVAAAL